MCCECAFGFEELFGGQVRNLLVPIHMCLNCNVLYNIQHFLMCWDLLILLYYLI